MLLFFLKAKHFLTKNKKIFISQTNNKIFEEDNKDECFYKIKVIKFSICNIQFVKEKIEIQPSK